MNTPHDRDPPPAPDPLAVELSRLDPAPHGFDWNRLMFAAGRASKARALRFWRAAAGAGAAAALGLGVALFVQLGRPPAERVVYIERVAPPAPQQLPPLTASREPRSEAPTAVPAKPQAAEEVPWSLDPPPAPGAAARWLSLRNEVLTAGLGVLPDPGPKLSAPRQ